MYVLYVFHFTYWRNLYVQMLCNTVQLWNNGKKISVENSLLHLFLVAVHCRCLLEPTCCVMVLSLLLISLGVCVNSMYSLC